MKVAVWYNLTQKAHEATIITKGRPVRQDAPASEREKSRREFFTGSSREEALQALANTQGMTLDEIMAAVVKDSKVVYKGKREHPNGWSRKAEQPEVVEA